MQRILTAATCCLVLGAGPAWAHESPNHRIADLTQHLQEQPQDAEGHLQRGELYRLEGNWPAAEADYRTAGDLGADSALVAVCLAALELKRGNPEGALESLRLVTDPESPALFIKGRALRDLGRFGEAGAVLEQAVARADRPRPEDYLELSAVVLEQGDGFIPQAVEILDEGARRLGPVAPLILAAVELEVRREGFEAALERLVAVPPALACSPAWMTRRGEILMLAGRGLEAEAAFTEALDSLRSLPVSRRSAPANVSLAAKLRQFLRLPEARHTGATP